MVIPMALPPLLEVPNRDDVIGDTAIEHLLEDVVVDGDVAPQTVAKAFDLIQHGTVVRNERMTGVPAVLHERMTDEQRSGERRIDPLKVDLAVGESGEPIERRPFITHRGTALLVPPRVGVFPTQKVRSAPLQPLRVDRSDHSRSELVRLD